MRYSRIPPGDSPMADAYNLMVAAHHNDKCIADTVSARVTNWAAVAAHLAAIASLYAGYADYVTPKGGQSPTGLLAEFADKHKLVSA